MKHLVLVVCASLAVLAFPVRALSQDGHADSPKTTLTVATVLVVGPTILQPGEYRFQCRTFGGRTFLVITSVSTGKEITRVPCVKETLDAPVSASEYRAVVREDGMRTLTSVRIKGEAVAHRLLE